MYNHKFSQKINILEFFTRPRNIKLRKILADWMSNGSWHNIGRINPGKFSLVVNLGNLTLGSMNDYTLNLGNVLIMKIWHYEDIPQI